MRRAAACTIWRLNGPGTGRNPQQYSVKARFVNLGLNAVGLAPGFAGVSGNIDGNERGGTFYLNAQNTVVDLPQVFHDKLAFDVLNAQAGWVKKDDEFEVKLSSISFSNADLVGNVSGVYQTVANGRGVIDLAGSASRVEVRSVARYVPLEVGERGRNWLQTAFQGGTAGDVKLRLKGNLNDFPFPENRGGLFEVTARVSGGVLDYAGSWPKMENIDGDVKFHGRRMDVVVRDAAIMGAKLARVHAEIPDLTIADRMLTVGGEAEGATADFFKFIEQSPVIEYIDRFTDNIRAEGRGKLALKLAIPLSNPRETRVEGGYQFINNQLQGEGDLFAYEQVNGKLEFTESSVRVPGVTMTLLGGPATLTGATQRDGAVRLNLAGRANFDEFRRVNNAGWLQSVHGATDWRASIALHKRLADIVLESTLQGVATDLPAPLAKAAADSMPFKLERRVTGVQQDRLSVTLGNVMSAQLLRRRDGNQIVIEHGTVSLGGSAAEPEHKGLWITGSLKSLDLDQWLALFKPGADSGQLAGVDVKFGTLDVFGRRFHDLAITGSAQSGVWQTVLVGTELVGEMTWRPQGKGKVTARMKNLVVPAATPGRAKTTSDKDQPIELPALDIVADNFQVNQANLGRLELSAVPDGRDWRIERLRVSSPETTLTLDGLWQGWLTQPRTMVNVKLETSDIGKLLVRFGYPEGIKRGSAKLEGPLSWAGNPSELDYATLSGNFLIEANKGQFVKLDPGIGKLLGVLSLQSLPRRLSLDFRDIFTEGLAFDEIVGTVKVNRGVANTENLRIQGPAVRVQMSGDVDLNAETQKLRVKVFPSVSDSLSVAGALVAGPIAGIAAFVAQKILKDPINQMAAYQLLCYGIVGRSAGIEGRLERVNRKSGKSGESRESAMRGTWTLALWCAVSTMAQAADFFTVAPELWDRPRTARAVLEQPAIRQALNVHLAQRGSRLVIHHGYGQDPLLQAEELRAWLMALAIDGERISLINDVVPNQPLKIEILK